MCMKGCPAWDDVEAIEAAGCNVKVGFRLIEDKEDSQYWVVFYKCGHEDHVIVEKSDE